MSNRGTMVKVMDLHTGENLGSTAGTHMTHWWCQQG